MDAALAAGGDGEVDARHDLVAGQDAGDEHPVVLELVQVVHGRCDGHAGVKRLQRADDGADERGRAGSDRDVDDRARVARNCSTRSGTAVASRA
jgi:hypothetical protein